jgi:uncharacterized membrane protein YgdD (TMEM256/DUF423 family)
VCGLVDRVCNERVRGRVAGAALARPVGVLSALFGVAEPRKDIGDGRDRYDGLVIDRVFLSLGAVSAFIAVAAGAFGAHALRDRMSADMLGTWQTAAAYQMYHALALLAVGIVLGRFSADASPWLTAAGWLFAAGTLLFSGSLYALALSGTTWLGAITPLGGVAFLLGWAAVAIGVWRR